MAQTRVLLTPSVGSVGKGNGLGGSSQEDGGLFLVCLTAVDTGCGGRLCARQIHFIRAEIKCIFDLFKF